MYWLWFSNGSNSSARNRGAQPFYTPALPVHVLHRVNHRKLVENNRANILRDFKFRTVKQLLASQPDVVVVDKEQKRAAAKDEAIPSDSNSIGEEHKRSGNIRNWFNYGKRCKRWDPKWSLVVRPVTPNLWQIPGLTSEVFVKKDAVQTFRSIEHFLWFPLHVCIYTHWYLPQWQAFDAKIYWPTYYAT